MRLYRIKYWNNMRELRYKGNIWELIARGDFGPPPVEKDYLERWGYPKYEWREEDDEEMEAFLASGMEAEGFEDILW